MSITIKKLLLIFVKKLIELTTEHNLLLTVRLCFSNSSHLLTGYLANTRLSCALKMHTGFELLGFFIGGGRVNSE